MGAAVPLRTDYDGPKRRRLAKASADANQTRWLLSLAVITTGASGSLEARHRRPLCHPPCVANVLAQ